MEKSLMFFMLGLILGAMLVASTGWIGYKSMADELSAQKAVYTQAIKDAKAAEKVWKSTFILEN